MKKYVNYSFSIPDPSDFLELFIERREKLFSRLKSVSDRRHSYEERVSLSEKLIKGKSVDRLNTASLILFHPDTHARIQAIFEVRRYLAVEYDHEMKQEFGSVDCLGLYSLGAIAMFESFEREKNFGWLSTGFKMCDRLETISCDNAEECELGIIALEKEREILRAVVDAY